MSRVSTLSPRIGYVLKRYPRYSETFVVQEILAHEAAGLDIEIFALRPPSDTHFQDIIAQVRAPVTYLRKPTQGRVSPCLTSDAPTAASYFWAELQEASQLIPQFWQKLAAAEGERASTVYQAAWLAREIIRKEISHLHAHFGTVATSVARLAAHFTGIPYTFTAHAKDIFHDSIDPADLTRKLQDAAAVITVSDYNVAYLRDRYGEAAAKVERIYNGLPLERLPYQSPEARSPRILSVCRLVEKKGVSVLIEACDRLRQRGLPFSCEIIGSGPLEAALQSQITTLGLTPWVKILGPRPQGEVFQHLQQAAVFAAPYIIGQDGNRDGLPTVLLEAMALGTPCVATDVTGIPEVVQPEITGLLVPQGDAAALATALERLLQDAPLRTALAARARENLEAQFDIHRNAAQLRSRFGLSGASPAASESTDLLNDAPSPSTVSVS
ncbi:glycosyltransferase family 4 protein [Geitlerinema sp. PCC 7407]|uniref:glycosyltransferase family 4 protein n=1 Tax=Geitlerinema sp. PCC 7407 TaxID=1173025 RepID=UPI00029FA55F|nr:glycosyltransferase family 4 protein [Geitlerinema sp. PCC 7407]AFY66313.1 glycosyl transferase group 1 [Geitlerinema sp. PCC 7407]